MSYWREKKMLRIIFEVFTVLISIWYIIWILLISSGKF